MAGVDDLDQVVEQCQFALSEFVKGDPEPMKMMFSSREDVTLASPYGSPARGWKQVAETMERTASYLRDGESVVLEPIAKCVTSELAYVVVEERGKAKVEGEVIPYTLRATLIFRPEDGTWKIVHRHADPITTSSRLQNLLLRE